MLLPHFQLNSILIYYVYQYKQHDRTEFYLTQNDSVLIGYLLVFTIIHNVCIMFKKDDSTSN